MNSSLPSQAGESKSRLSLPLRLLAMGMRRLPTDIRRVGMIWESLYRSIGGGGFDDEPEVDARWPQGLQPPIRGTQHGQLMMLNLGAWPERRDYFSGRYFQQDVCRLLEAMLSEGDQYLDIGANIGMTTLLAARLIGKTGVGLVFEPNPIVYARLAQHIAINGLTQITAFPYAVSSEESTSRLVVPDSNTGLGSLVFAPGTEGQSFEVKTVTQAAMIDRLDPKKRTFLKIDVEGYEVNVLRGISGILSWPEVAVVAEITEELLQNAGFSGASIFEIMASHGFVAHEVELKPGRWGKHFQIRRLPEPRVFWQYDALFAKPGSEFYARKIAPLLVGS